MSDENKKTILLVEDEAILAISQKMTLEKYGYSIVTANSGEKAIELFTEDNIIDLILMDIDLGSGIDGTEAAGIILKDRDIPVVFLSSHTEPAVVEKTEKITSYGYVVKNSGITVLDASIKMAFKLFYANRKIGESELKQKAMIANISDIISIITPDGVIKYTSPNIVKWFGWKPEELLDTDGRLTVHPDDFEHVQKLFNKLIEKDNSSQSIEHRYKCKDGSYKSISLTATNLVNDPVIKGVLLNYHDITDRKLADEIIKTKSEELVAANEELTSAIEEMEATNEELLRTNEDLLKSEEKYRLQFLNMDSYNSMYEVITDKEGKPCDFRFIMVNEAYEKYVGIKASDLIGKTLLEVYPETEQYWIDKMTEAVLAGTPLHFENFSQVMNTYTEINLYTPQKGQLAMTTANISGRKKAEVLLAESELRYRSLFNQMNEGLIIMTLDGKLYEINPAFAEMHGYTVDEIKGMDIRDLDILKENTMESRTDVLRRLQAGEIVRFEVEHYHHDGHIITLGVSTSMINIGDQPLYLAIHTDHTAREHI